MFYVLYETYYILAKYKQKLGSECISRPKHYAQCSLGPRQFDFAMSDIWYFSVSILCMSFLKVVYKFNILCCNLWDFMSKDNDNWFDDVEHDGCRMIWVKNTVNLMQYFFTVTIWHLVTNWQLLGCKGAYGPFREQEACHMWYGLHVILLPKGPSLSHSPIHDVFKQSIPVSDQYLIYWG